MAATEIDDSGASDAPGPVEQHDSFLNHPVVEAYIALRIWGRVVSPLDVVAAEIRSRSRPGARVFAIASRGLEREIEVATRVPDRQFELTTLSSRDLEPAERSVQSRGLDNVRVHRATLDALPLEPGAHEVGLSLQAAHAVADLERYWKECRRALCPEGILLAQEYVGPAGFCWPQPQVDAANRALEILVPAAHKKHHRAVTPALAAELRRDRPELASRSTAIVETCGGSGFEIVAQVGAGGALLHPVLALQIDTYQPADWTHNLVLSSLFREEDRLLRQGVLRDEFAMFIARAPR